MNRHNPISTREVKLADHRLNSIPREPLEHFNIMLMTSKRTFVRVVTSFIQPSVIVNRTTFSTLHDAKTTCYDTTTKLLDFFFRNNLKFSSTIFIMVIFFDFISNFSPSKVV